MKQFHSKIVGSTFCDGQKFIKTLSSGDILNLIPEPENKFDNKAIRIENLNGDKIGYLPRNTAEVVSEDIKTGLVYVATVSEVTGKDKDNQGCNLLVMGE